MRVATRQTSATRAKDSDRNDTCKVLDSALSEGQLSMEEHRQRVSAATNATTLGELAALVADLQNSNAPVQLPTLKQPRQPGSGGWGFKLATAVVLVLLGMGIGWGLYGNTSSPLSFQTDPGAKPDGIAAEVLTPPRQLQSLNGVNGLFQQMRNKFGNTMGYELHIDPDSAMLYRPDPQDSRKEVYYRYVGGWGDPQSPDAVDEEDRLVDLAKFDIEKALAILRGAPETLNTKPEDVSSSWLRITPSEDPSTPELVNVEVIVSSDFGGGTIDLYPDGTVKEIYRSSR
ncbi:membrane protein [Mycolicibacterium wolinskyi]|uniref:Membrane protein n=1 Tax=Mycolicibacterium wolinskyi TaxID=59750 RepID=A0A132PMP8_9MYCO|nr:membrane protein [Mycolicibacterium wolinskyi]